MAARCARALLVPAVAACALTALPATPSAARRKPCASAHSVTLVENRQVRVYRRTRGSREMLACVFSTDRIVTLDFPPDKISGFGPPALDLNGSVIGYAIDTCSAVACKTSVGVQDLHDVARFGDQRFVAASPYRRRLVKIGSLRVRKNGAVAWTTCPDRQSSIRALYATQLPNCTGPGDKVRVLVLQGGARPRKANRRVLDRGARIDPSSLRLRHGTLSWRHGGTLRHAPLN